MTCHEDEVNSLQDYTDEPLDEILLHVEEGPVVLLDRWKLKVWENPLVR